MDYVEMIKDPELVLGFQELVTDSDAVVVKRAVKVFTCVYHHTLRLLSSGDLEEEVVMKSWSSVNGVVDRLLAMVRQCNNEGILIHLLRFLEAAVTAHLSFDVTRCSSVFERGREVIKSGLKALKDLITTPYVGGSSFIFGVRALISIACLRPDLWDPVTDLLKKQISSLPPTLFDHNVRSLHKALQKNLFRLLRRADKYELKEKLIEMMVRVGVPRKAIAPWAPQALQMRKRSPPEPPSDLSVIGRLTPPEKKQRLEPPSIARSSRSRSNTPEIPKDPRLQLPQNENLPKVVENTPELKPNNADLLFLTSLLPKVNSENSLVNKEDDSSSSEKDLYKVLNLENVCSLVIKNINDIPDKEPKNFISSFKNHGLPSEDIEIMRTRLSSLFDKYIIPSNVDEFKSKSRPLKKSEFSSTTSLSSELPKIEAEFSSSSSLSSEPSKIQERVLSSSSSASSTPASTPPLADTDMRQVYSNPLPTKGDVDMRIPDPRLVTRDPRLAKDPRIRRDVDCRSTFPQSVNSRVDNILEPVPRIDPRTIEIPRDQVQRVDHRSLENTRIDQIPRTDPRTSETSRRDPRTMGNSRDPRNIETSRVDQISRSDPRAFETSRGDPRTFSNSRVEHIPRTDSRTEDVSMIDQLSRTDPRTTENCRMNPRVENGPRVDPRLSLNSKRNSETRKSRWDPRPEEMSPLSPNGEKEFQPQGRPNDPRVIRNPNQGQGLLPHPDPRVFQRENMDPRFSFQKPMNPGELMVQPNFMPQQPQFAFNNPFLGNIAMPPPNGMQNMFNNLSFGWDNNLRAPSQQSVLLAQTLASVQQGLLSNSILNR